MKAKGFWSLFALLAALGLVVFGTSQQATPQEHSTGLFAMGTYISLTAYGPGAESTLSQAVDTILELEALWSTTDENSEIHAVNHSQGAPVSLSDQTAELLRFTCQMARQTDGALDPTIYPLVNAWGFIDQAYRVPSQQEIDSLLPSVGYEKIALSGNTVTLPQGMQLDLGAVGKGYTGELVANLLKENGITSALLDIGGNIQMVGGKPDGTSWRLGIQNPFGQGSFGIWDAEDCAVVTSGGYERYFTDETGKTYWHILDPHTGYPARSDLASVTIISKEGKLCDALSTAIFVMGLDQGIGYWQSHGDFDMLLMTQSGEIYLTEGMEGRFTLTDDFADREIHILKR